MFTICYLKSLKPKKSPYRIYEKASRGGFGIQVSTKGTKTFFYAYSIDDKQRFIKLGIFANQWNQTSAGITLKEAGLLWQKWYKLKSAGHDPQIIRDNEINATQATHKKSEAKKIAIAKQGTYEQLLTAYIDWLKSNNKRSADNVQKSLDANAYTIIAASTKAKQVTPEHINATLAIVEKRGANVLSNRLRSYLLTAFKRGMSLNRSTQENDSTIQFGLERNPVNDITKSEIKERAGERFLSEDEVKTLWQTLPKTHISPQTIGILKLMLATGQRVEEVLNINLNAIDFKLEQWELQKTKAKRPHIVPLNAIALDIIKTFQANPQGFIFSLEKTGQLIKINSLSQACLRFCKRTGFTKFTPRSLRRTWKTLAGRAGISKFDRDRYQNHSMNDVSARHYDRYDYLAEKRHVALVWNAYLSDILQEY